MASVDGDGIAAYQQAIFDHAAYLGLNTETDSDLLWLVEVRWMPRECGPRARPQPYDADLYSLPNPLFLTAQEALNAALPLEWSTAADEDGRTFFYNETTGESIWHHPQDDHYPAHLQEQHAPK